jgi:hypothetical protein
VIITHGRARRRMVAFGVGVAATMARTRVPELIAEAIARQSPTAPTPTPAAPAVEEPDALTAPGLESAS